MSKSQATDAVAKITVGTKDTNNNLIVNVLAKQNEFAIYEIETNNIHNRLKVLIDGYSDTSEEEIINRFNLVKQEYIQAKGMLSKSSNFEMMKQRVAHTLSTCLSSDDVDGKREFIKLIDTIREEHEELVINRALYLSPAFSFVIILFLISLCQLELRIDNNPYWQVISSLLAASLGGSLSILINAKTLNFEEFKTKKHYFLLGFERILLSFVAGAVAYIALKSGLLSPILMSKGYWSLMLVLVVSGFSESFIPSFISKSEKAIGKK